MTLSAESFAGGTLEIDDFWKWDAYAREKRLTDGLVVAPPTVDRVSAILKELDAEPDEIGVVPPAGGVLTKEVLAVQCAMAGCLPAHARVVARAIQLMLEPEFNLYGVQCTTNACAPITIVSGPVVKEMGFHYREGSFGGGSHASAAIGRAIRLILWNVGGAYPGNPAMSPLGHPGRYIFIVAENNEDSPWTPIHMDFGFSKDDSCVTVFACQPPNSLAVAGDADEILNILRESLPTPAENMFHVNGQYMVAFNARVADQLAKGGFDKTAVRKWLYERARYRVGRLREGGMFRSDLVRSYWGWRDDCGVDMKTAKDSDELPMVKSIDDIHVLVTGALRQWWGGFLPGWGRYGGYARCGRINL